MKTPELPNPRYDAFVASRKKRKPIAVDPIDHDAALLLAISRLSGELPGLKARSQESAALAMAKLIELHRERNPQTIDDLVRICVKLELKSEHFFSALDEAWESLDHPSDSP